MKYYHGMMKTALLAVTLLFACGKVQAQPDALTLTKGRVTAVLDTFSGRFAAMREDGKTMLFVSDRGLTSHVSVRAGNVIWTNYGKSQMTAPWPLRNLGRGIAEVLPDRLRYTWQVRAGRGTLRIAMELEPVSDSLYEELRLHLIVENGTGLPQDIGLTAMEDLDADGDDYVALRHSTRSITVEQEFQGNRVPERLLLESEAYVPDSGFCRLSGAHLTAPDRIVVGRWSYHGGLGTAVYGYEAVARTITDAALLLQWDSQVLADGARLERSTAIGFMAPRPEIVPTHTFARKYIVPIMWNSAILSVVGDSATTVRISAPYADSFLESLNGRNGSWDTTLAFVPGTASCAMLPIDGVPKKKTDSLTFYRQHHVVVEADREIGLMVRPLSLTNTFNAWTVWPVTTWDSSYLSPGRPFTMTCYLACGAEPTEISLRQTIEGFFYDYSGYSWTLTPVSTVRIALPGEGGFIFQSASFYGWYFNHWDPKKSSDRELSHTGAGDVLEGSGPIHLSASPLNPLWPGADVHQQVLLPRWDTGTFSVPPRSQLGTEYVFVPFRKPRAKTQEDFIRVIAYEDDTELTFFDGTPPLRLDRSGHVDTLLDRPTVIRASKPVVVYQKHLSVHYLESDTVFTGNVLPLLPHDLWGRRYYSVSDDGFRPNVNPGLNPWYRDAIFYENLYLIIVTKAAHRSEVFIDDFPLAASRFTVFGEWAYAYVDIPPGYHIVRSDAPFLTVTCGGGGGKDGMSYNNFGMSYIPPFR